MDDGRAVHSLLDPSVTRLQETYVRRVIDAVGDQSNVLFEISNESTAGSIAWQNHMVEYIKSAERPAIAAPGRDHGRVAGRTQSPTYWPAAAASSRRTARSSIRNPSDGRKVVVADTDHLCGVCGDGPFPWKALTRGLNPLFMDEYDGTAVGVGARDGDPRDPAWEQVTARAGRDAARRRAGSGSPA